MKLLLVKKASVKRHRFPFLNDISDLVLGCFHNLVIKPSINSIKPWIKFNWIHKHLILDFSFSNWIFLVPRALISKKYTVKISIFVFLNLLNQFLSFFSIPTSFSPIIFGFFQIFFWYIFLYFLICIFFIFYGEPKNG